jgi:phage/plasmid-like protein (TIGR03299 family)
MSHMIESLFLNREAAWHNLGVIVQEAPNSEEAIKLAGLDWEVKPHPVTAVFNGAVKAVDGFMANIRETDGKVMGVVTDRYKVVQNREAFSFTDNLIGDGVVYESAGSLTNGKVWMLAKLPEKTILGDATVPYLVFTNSFDGKGAIQVAITPIRVVCQNTLNLALRETNRSWSTRHMGSIESKMYEAHRTLEFASSYMDSLSEEADRLANKKITNDEFDAFVEALFPIDELDSTRKNNNVRILRNELSMRYFQAPDNANFVGTAWGFIQSVTDLVNHTSPRRSTPTYRENLFMKVTDGHAVVDQAYTLVA